MRMKLWLISTLCLVAPTILTAGEVDDILDKHWEALGGKKAIAAIKSLEFEGKIVINMGGGGMEIPMKMKMKDGNKVRFEVTFQGQTMTQSLNGDKGWKVNPMMGSSSPEDLTDAEIKEMKKQADFPGELYDYKAKGVTIEYKGKVDVEGTETFHLAATNKDGDSTQYYIDTENYILIKSSGKQMQNGMEMEADNYFSDYKAVNDIMVAHSMTIQPKVDGAPKTELRFDSVKINPSVEDAYFSRPKETAEAKKP